MKKRILIIFFLLFYTAIFFLNTKKLDKKEEIVIKKLIVQALNEQNILKDNQALLKKLPKYIIYAGKRYNREEYKEEIIHLYQNIKNNDIKIINSSFKIKKTNCIYLKDNSVDCYVKEIIQTTYTSENNLSYIVKGQENRDIKFNLKRDSNNKWFIEEEQIFGFEPISPQ